MQHTMQPHKPSNAMAGVSLSDNDLRGQFSSSAELGQHRDT